MWIPGKSHAIPERPLNRQFVNNQIVASSSSSAASQSQLITNSTATATATATVPSTSNALAHRHPLSVARRKRASKPKVRTGCTTCKIRRIKCDETKPSCKRCTTTGRKCDGYEFPREDIAETESLALSPPPNAYATWSQLFLPSSISVVFPGDAQERRIFHRFQVCTIPAFAGVSESGFWESLVLKVGQQEPIIRNAIIALGTLHEDYQIRGGRYSERLIEDPKHQHALQLYGNALRQLNKRLNEGDQTNAKLAIISSILFTCFEVLRRQNMAAVIHYQAGMRELIRQINLNKAAANSSYSTSASSIASSAPIFRQIPQNELDELLRVFARYDIQACTFSKMRAEELETELPLLPPASFTLAEARRQLDNLLITVYQYVKSQLGTYRYWPEAAVPENWRIHRSEVVNTFEAWLIALENFFLNPDLRLRSADAKRMLGLRLQIKVAIMMLKTCIDSGPETVFDAFYGDFEDIVTRVEHISHALSLVDGAPLQNESTPFTMELGVIHPLFFVATKCRDSILRRRAIAQLKKAGREGVWEGPVVALVAERVVEIEENGVRDGDVVPEQNRIHEIKKTVDYDSKQVFVEAMRATDRTWKHWERIHEVVRF